MANKRNSSTAIAKREKPTLTVAPEHSAKAEIITGYMDAFAAIDKRPLTTELYDLYVKTLCSHRPEFSLNQIKKGLQAYLETGNKWPWPADLISLIEDEI